MSLDQDRLLQALPTDTTSLIDAALSYAISGLAVFPLFEPRGQGCSCGKVDCTNQGKHPRTSRGLLDATTDEEVIKRWWKQWPAANIGVRLGDGLFVVDIDGPPGLATLRGLEAEHEALPPTLVVATGRIESDGYHHYLRSDDRVPSRKLGLKLEIKGQGGYVVAPPSVHVSGKRYKFITPAPIAAAPTWLLLVPKVPRPTSDSSHRPRDPATSDEPAKRWAARGLEKECADLARTEEGGRNDKAHRVAFRAGQFIGGGLMDRADAERQIRAACESCGLPDREINGLLRQGGGLDSGQASPCNGPEPAEDHENPRTSNSEASAPPTENERTLSPADPLGDSTGSTIPPPSSVPVPNAEEALAWAVVHQPEHLDDVVVGKVTSVDLERPGPSAILRAVIGRRERGEPIDSVVVMDDLKDTDHNTLVEARRILESQALQVNAPEYARLILRDSAARRLKEADSRVDYALRNLLGKKDLSGVALARDMAELSTKLVLEHDEQDPHRRRVSIPLSADVDEAVRRLLARSAKTERPVQLPWPSLNEALAGGLWPGLHVAVGGTGTHKTLSACQMALHAIRSGIPVLYIAFEMREIDLVCRFLGLLGGENWSGLQTGRVSEEQIAALLLKHGAMLRSPLLRRMYESPRGETPVRIELALAEMRAAFPQKRRGERPFLVVLDFLQLVGGDKKDDLRMRIADAAYAAQEAARKVDAAIVLLSSASRENTKNLQQKGGPGTELPHPSTLVGTGKESGEIEYAADNVLVFQPEMRPLGDWGSDGSTTINVACAKVRFAPPSWVTLRYVNGRIEDVKEIASRAPWDASTPDFPGKDIL